MKPYVIGFKHRGIDAVAVDLPRGGAERAVPVFIKTSGRGHDVIGGGQSFGGRVASMAAVEADFGGLILFLINQSRKMGLHRGLGRWQMKQRRDATGHFVPAQAQAFGGHSIHNMYIFSGFVPHVVQQLAGQGRVAQLAPHR